MASKYDFREVYTEVSYSSQWGDQHDRSVSRRFGDGLSPILGISSSTATDIVHIAVLGGAVAVASNPKTKNTVAIGLGLTALALWQLGRS